MIICSRIPPANLGRISELWESETSILRKLRMRLAIWAIFPLKNQLQHWHFSC